MRAAEFIIEVQVKDSVLWVYAKAPYMRGESPEPSEHTYIGEKVLEIYPDAKFVGVKRETRPIAKELGDDAQPMMETWVFEWVVL